MAKHEATWWRSTGRTRLAWIGAALLVVFLFLYAVPLVAPLGGPRLASLLRPAFALAVLGALLLFAAEGLAALHRRFDRGAD